MRDERQTDVDAIVTRLEEAIRRDLPPAQQKEMLEFVAGLRRQLLSRTRQQEFADFARRLANRQKNGMSPDSQQWLYELLYEQKAKLDRETLGIPFAPKPNKWWPPSTH